MQFVYITPSLASLKIVHKKTTKLYQRVLYARVITTLNISLTVVILLLLQIFQITEQKNSSLQSIYPTNSLTRVSISIISIESASTESSF